MQREAERPRRDLHKLGKRAAGEVAERRKRRQGEHEAKVHRQPLPSAVVATLPTPVGRHSLNHGPTTSRQLVRQQLSLGRRVVFGNCCASNGGNLAVMAELDVA